MIFIEDFSFVYEDGTKALQSINLHVKKGEFLAIMGPNGAGKTTLCLSLNGIIPQIISGTLEGKVIVAGMNTIHHPVYEISQKVGMVFQDPETQLVCPDVKSEIAFGPENLGIAKDEIIRRMKWALRVVRLEGAEERTPDSLSGGQKQRLAIASSLTMLPEILVLDEPTSQLDPIGTTEVLSVIKDLNKRHGITIVMVTHKSEEIIELADRIIVLDKGRLVAKGTPREVFSRYNLLNKIYVKLPDVTNYFTNLRAKGLKLNNLPYTLEDGVNQTKELLNIKITFAKSRLKPRYESGRQGKPILEVRNLSYIYPGNVLALKNVNLKIYKGEFVGIIGQNGSGKTTLAMNMVRILRPTKGRVFFMGEDIQDYDIGELTSRIGLILQNPDYQLFKPTVGEDVAFGPENLNLPPDEVEKRVKEALKAVGLYEKQESYPFALSLSDRRKIAVAAVLSMKPDVLIFDEPTTGQDYKGRLEIAELAKKANLSGTTVIMITHDMYLIAKYTYRTIVLRDGEVLLNGPTRDVLYQVETLNKAFIKPPQIIRFAQNFELLQRSRILTVDELSNLTRIQVRGD